MQALQTEFPKSVIALCCLGACLLIGIAVAKFVDRIHDRLSLRDDASDMSDHTRELLKARFAMSFSSLARQEEARDQRERDLMRASKFGRLWMAHAAMGRRKRKEQHTLSISSILNEKNSQVGDVEKSSPRLVSFKPKEETITEMKEDDSLKETDLDNESVQAKPAARSESAAEESCQSTLSPRQCTLSDTHSVKSDKLDSVSINMERKTPNGNVNKADHTVIDIQPKKSKDNKDPVIPKNHKNRELVRKDSKTIAQARRHFEFRDDESEFPVPGNMDDTTSSEGQRPTTGTPSEKLQKDFSSDEDEFPSLQREGTTATINLSAYESKAKDKDKEAKPKTTGTRSVTQQPRTNAWGARPVSSKSLRRGDKPGARPLTAGTSKRITPGARKSARGVKKWCFMPRQW